jgi:hypothetical protein
MDQEYAMYEIYTKSTPNKVNVEDEYNSFSMAEVAAKQLAFNYNCKVYIRSKEVKVSYSDISSFNP